MKKYNVLILALFAIIFTQCNPKEEKQEVILTVNASLNKSRTSFDIQDKIIRWEEGDVIFSKNLRDVDMDIIRTFTMTELSDDRTSATFQYQTYQEPMMDNTIPPSTAKEFYHVKPTELGATPLTRVDLDMSSQTGNIEDFGKYHVGKADISFTAEFSGNDHHYKTNANFRSVTSLAWFDFSNFNLDDNITITYNNSYYIFRYSSPEGAEYLNANDYGLYGREPVHKYNNITITEPSTDTYVTFLAPDEGTEENLVVTFSDEHGTTASITFKNGIKQNRLYTANGNPIKITPGAKMSIE